MMCPKCKKGTIEEDYFDENIGECDYCHAQFKTISKRREYVIEPTYIDPKIYKDDSVDRLLSQGCEFAELTKEVKK